MPVGWLPTTLIRNLPRTGYPHRYWLSYFGQTGEGAPGNYPLTPEILLPAIDLGGANSYIAGKVSSTERQRASISVCLNHLQDLWDQ